VTICSAAAAMPIIAVALDSYAETLEYSEQSLAVAITPEDRTNARAKAAEHAARAKERIERIERGDNVEGGLSKQQIDIKAVLIEAGWTKADFRRARRLAELGDRASEEVSAEVMRRHKRGEDVAIRAVHRKYFGSAS
jgi:hypothetical protein